MCRVKFSFIFSFTALFFIAAISDAYGQQQPVNQALNDSLTEYQGLSNGKIWLNVFYMVTNDQFYVTKDLLTGSVTVLGEKYSPVKFKYDIYNDQLIMPSSVGSMIELNKEMVDSFSFSAENKEYHFVNLTNDSISGLSGYAEELARGISSLYLKHYKELYHMGGQADNDRFYEKQKLYFVIGKKAYLVTGRKELLKLTGNQKENVLKYIRDNKIRILIKAPETIVPVMNYYNSLLRMK
ncbi:MAG: hypothetical protein U0T33_12540 [Bacteroidales bacterium]